ncbi:hypothetical protein V8046_004919 [Vibrio parahaemolyticus]|nr:hypothetical protein [Vibrio parahaemolyticus]EIV8637022.1 hypothetical protein [Vibrio parahaemolyticus]EIZ1450731.1 hypothetical protein [Vibrio parahaemolyticus]EJF4460591.1 hypothetical protein [Vibrio parahaemolyticus]EKL0056985.1 hypothetical protein [Vibrio parahaemolyticus]
MEKLNLKEELFRSIEAVNKYKNNVILKVESFISKKQPVDEFNIESGNGELIFMYLNDVRDPVLVLENVDGQTICKELAHILEVLEIYYDMPKVQLLSSNIKFASLAKDDLLKLNHSAEEIIQYFSPFLNSKSNQDYLVLNGKRNHEWRETWQQKYC